MFPEGFWEERTDKFMHIKSIPPKSKRVLKLDADLQAALLSSEAEFLSLFTCNDVDPQTASSAVAHDEYKCCGERGEDELNNSSVVLLVQRNPKPLLQTLPSDTAMNLGLPSRGGRGWCRHSNHGGGAGWVPDRARGAAL